MKLSSSKHHVLSICNLTPDSFFQGSRSQSCDQLRLKIQRQVKEGIYCFDFGAFSTAPKSTWIDSECEKERYESILFPLTDELNRPELTLFFDTFRPEVMDFLAQSLMNHKANLVWNDVSGQIDQDVLTLLEKHPSLSYVFGHNLAPERELSHRHMDYVSHDKSILDEMLSHFEQSLLKFKEKGLEKRVILDPCFGFSKLPFQDWQLAHGLGEILEKFSTYPWLIGISHKKFLRTQRDNQKEGADKYLGAFWRGRVLMEYWSKKWRERTLFFRVH